MSAGGASGGSGRLRSAGDTCCRARGLCVATPLREGGSVSGCGLGAAAPLRALRGEVGERKSE